MHCTDLGPHTVLKTLHLGGLVYEYLGCNGRQPAAGGKFWGLRKPFSRFLVSKLPQLYLQETNFMKNGSNIGLEKLKIFSAPSAPTTSQRLGYHHRLTSSTSENFSLSYEIDK